jgi:hypothetical protein
VLRRKIKMSRKNLIVVILVASLLSAVSVFVVKCVKQEEVETRWSAYQDNGDKPGVEFIITEGVMGTTGWLVVHDANDNRILERFPMQVKRVAPDEYMVVVTIRGRVKNLSIKYIESADGMTRMATIKDSGALDDSDAPPAVCFTKSTTRDRVR